ncbi:hypothetical protein [Acinetobacter nosocomialis]
MNNMDNPANVRHRSDDLEITLIGSIQNSTVSHRPDDLENRNSDPH